MFPKATCVLIGSTPQEFHSLIKVHTCYNGIRERVLGARLGKVF